MLPILETQCEWAPNLYVESSAESQNSVKHYIEKLAEYYINYGSYMVSYGVLLQAKTERQMI